MAWGKKEEEEKKPLLKFHGDDEIDLWRDAVMRSLNDWNAEAACEEADCIVEEYRKRGGK